MITKVRILWDYPFMDNTGYLLQRSANSGSLWNVNIPITSSFVLEHEDTNVVLGGTYWYKIAATNQFGTGSFSNTASVYISSPGVITLTISAAPDTRPYDGTTGSAIAPTVDGLPIEGDIPDFIQSFDTKHVAAGKTLTPTGSMISVSGYPYSYVYVTASVGQIDQVEINVYGSTDTKSYDGTTVSTALPFIDYLAPGDTVDSSSLTQSYDDRLVGWGKSMIPSPVTINDGNGGNNYSQNTFTFNPVGLIEGPPSSSHYVVIPSDTNVPFDEGWFISIVDVASGSNGFMTSNYLQESDLMYFVTSSDFVSWSIVASQTPYYSVPSNLLYCTCYGYGNGRYIGIGSDSSLVTPEVQYSDDGGVTWNTASIPNVTEIIWDLIHDGTKFVGVGRNGMVVSSSNGIEWWTGSISNSAYEFNHIIQSGSRYVATGHYYGWPMSSAGEIFTSTDLVNWQAVSSSSPTSASYQDVAYSPTLNRFMAVGEGSVIAISSDGVNWTDQSFPTITAGELLSAVVWNSVDEKFEVASISGYVYETPDGINWNLVKLTPSYFYHGNSYQYVKKMKYDASINKTLIFGMGPPT